MPALLVHGRRLTIGVLLPCPPFANLFFTGRAVDVLSGVQACDALVAESVRRWKMEEDVVDDITAVVVFFNIRGPANATSPAQVDVTLASATASATATAHDADGLV